MKANKLILSTMLLLAMIAVGCSSDDRVEGITETELYQADNDLLQKYKWKLYGYVSTVDGKFENAPQSVSTDSFSISFEDDGTCKGYCATDWFSGSYITSGTSITFEMKDNSFFYKNLDPYREIYKTENERFYQCVSSSNHYGIYNNQLRLYFNNNKEYLTFNAFEK